jgi:hypothetical protein
VDLTTLRDSARSKSDEQATGYISDVELDRFINQGCKFIYAKICQRFEDYFIESGTALNGGLFNTVIKQQAYPLPLTMQKLIKVEHRAAGSINDNDWCRMERVNISNHRLDEYYPVREGYRPGFGYFIAGSNIYFRPVPAEAFSIRLWFIPRFVDLVAVDSIPAIPEEYHELIAEYASLQCLRKSGEPIWREANEMFTLELNNMLETIEVRDQQAEQMTITDDVDYYRNGR